MDMDKTYNPTNNILIKANAWAEIYDQECPVLVKRLKKVIASLTKAKELYKLTDKNADQKAPFSLLKVTDTDPNRKKALELIANAQSDLKYIQQLYEVSNDVKGDLYEDTMDLIKQFPMN